MVGIKIQTNNQQIPHSIDVEGAVVDIAMELIDNQPTPQRIMVCLALTTRRLAFQPKWTPSGMHVSQRCEDFMRWG